MPRRQQSHSIPRRVRVDSTVRDAFYRDYHCVLLADSMAEPIAHDAPRSNHEATLLTVQLLFGWTSTSDKFLEALSARAAA